MHVLKYQHYHLIYYLFLSLQSPLVHNSVWNISELEVDLSANLSQIALDDASEIISFDGRIQLSLKDFVASKETSNGFYEELIEYDGGEYIYDLYYKHNFIDEFNEVSLSVFGSVSNQTGESFLLNLDLSLDDSNLNDWVVFWDRCHQWYVCDEWRDTPYIGGDMDSGEYLGVNANLRFSANLAGVSDVVVVDFSLDSTSKYYADIELNLSYPGHIISLHGNIDYDYLLFSSDYEDTYYVGELFIEKPADGIQIKLDMNTATEPGEEEVSVEMRLDSNRDGVTDERDFLYGWYEQRNGIDLLIYADESNPDILEFESLF